MSPKDHKMIFAALVLLVVLLGLSVAWTWAKKDQTPADNTPQTTQPNVTTQSGIIKYNSQFPVIKTASRAEDYMGVRVLNLGTITSGTYKDKILALGLYAYTDNGGYPSYGNSMYVYYIAEANGTPVAWSRNYLHNIYIDPNRQDLIGFQNMVESDLSFLPREYSVENRIISSDQKVTYSTSDGGGLLPKDSLSNLTKVGTTESGFPILKDTNNKSIGNPYIPRYLVELPFGSYLIISPEPNFFSGTEFPQLSWTTGSRTVSAYRYGQYAYGWQQCFNGVTQEQVQNALVQTGITVKGEPVYEMNQQTFPSVYVCLHQQTKRYVYNPETQTGSYQETITYSEFVPTHPLFFWKNSQGDLLAFVRSDVVPAAEKAKPVVYLYPEEKERVLVKVDPIGGLTITDPDYGDGWIVDATPEGVLTNTKDGKQYPYLFWEGGKEGGVETPAEGFVVAKADISSTLNEKLTQFGLNKQERADFVEFWSEKLNQAPYYFITFITREEIDRVAPMVIVPKPDTVIRVLMDYKPLEKPITVKPLSIERTPRKGFTAVEWGGVLH